MKRYGEYGFLYVLTPGFGTDSFRLPPVVRRPERKDSELDRIWRPRAENWRVMGHNEVPRLAELLGVSLASLVELGTGYDGKAWTFPERNGAGLVVGVSRRFENGDKRFASGGHRGLTYSRRWREMDGPVVIVEGASDVAAGITLGLATIGRPNNTGGLAMLTVLLHGCQRRIVVLGERDRKPDGRWPGMEGCRSIASGLGKALRRSVCARLVPEGSKDLRGWLNTVSERQGDLGKELGEWL